MAKKEKQCGSWDYVAVCLVFPKIRGGGGTCLGYPEKDCSICGLCECYSLFGTIQSPPNATHAWPL